MKHTVIKNSLLVFVLSLIAVSIVYAGDTNTGTDTERNSYNDFTIFSVDEYSLIEKNLLSGINSGNLGLQTSSAYFLGEMKSGKSLIPLLRLARNGETEEARIIAGLSLYKIESDIGMHLLKGLSQTDESQRVRNIYSKIYNRYVFDKREFVSN